MISMNTKGITRSVVIEAHHKLTEARSLVTEREKELQDAVCLHLANAGGSMRALAKRYGFAAGYISDLINRRRRVSDEVVKRLTGRAELSKAPKKGTK